MSKLDAVIESAQRTHAEALKRIRVPVGARVKWTGYSGVVVHTTPATYGQTIQVRTRAGYTWILRASEVEVVGGLDA